ncbi:MAG: ligase-associated DNA damage response endonuclease PdeM [Pseudomonadota bacterium]
MAPNLADPAKPKSEVRLPVADDWLIPLPEAALWWREEETLIVSDLHFEKGSSIAAGGQLLPPYDTSATLTRVEALCRALTPKRVISLGDSFHDVQAETRLCSQDTDRIRVLTSAYEWLWIEGNHDPDPPAHLGGIAMAEWRCRSLVFRHEPTGERGEISGHLHPVAKVRGRGRAVRRKCFISNGDYMTLPSLGAFTGGLNVCDPAIQALYPGGGSVFVVGKARIVPVPNSSLLADVPRLSSTQWRL